MNHKSLAAAAAVVVLVATPGTATAQPTHVVQRGDTLWSIAGAHGLSTDALAVANGMPADRHVLAGEAIRIPAPAQAGEAARVDAAPHPTAETVTPAGVQQVAMEHGVPASLAAAVAEQESGFNNALVSSADARGVMQILPGTWEFIQSNLAGYALEPASAQENVHAGILLLAQLLRQTGGDEVSATGAYYQGLASVTSVGLLPETRAYVANVMALRHKYGG